MRLTELLSEERVAVRHNTPERTLDKATALRVLAGLLANGARVDAAAVERVLTEREQLQSTCIGEGVAIPHATFQGVERLVGAVARFPEGIAVGLRSTACPPLPRGFRAAAARVTHAGSRAFCRLRPKRVRQRAAERQPTLVERSVGGCAARPYAPDNLAL